MRKDAGAHFEISVNGVPRTYRDVRETAIEAALFHKDRAPTDEVKVRDLRDDFVVVIGWKDGSAFVSE